MAKQTYPETALLRQVKGVGDLIATAYVLTIEDPHRFRKSRDAGCFAGLQPGRRNSGESEPQMRISKEGDEYERRNRQQQIEHLRKKAARLGLQLTPAHP